MGERLQEAIERARRERKGAIGQTPAPGKSHEENSGRVAVADPELQAIAEKIDFGAQAVAERVDGGAVESTAFEEEPGKAMPSELRTSTHSPTPPAKVRYLNTRKLELSEQALTENKVIAGNIYDPRVETYRQLRSQVLGTMKRNQWRTLAVTSAREGAGKTLTCVNLAISISQEVNQTVMLVDLDLRKPDVANTLGLDIEKGIIDHLVHGEPIERIMFNPGYPRLVVIPGTPQGHHVSEMLSSPEMRAFLADITNRYSDRIILFDLPPLLRNDDAMVFVPNADACLFVVEDGVTRPDEIEYCFQLLKHSKVIGTVLNKAR